MYKREDGMTPRMLIDTGVQERFFERIREHRVFDGYAIDAEEEGGAREGKGDGIVYFDPFDGTSNAVINMPMSTTGFSTRVAGEFDISVIFDPFEQRLYWAQRGHGAYVSAVWIDDEKRAYEVPATARRLETDLETVTFEKRYGWTDSNLTGKVRDRKLKWISMMGDAGMFMNHRSTGSNVHFSAMIADKRAHYVLTDTIGGTYDLSGWSLVFESGGMMFNIHGEEPTPEDHVAVTIANPKDFEAVLDITQECYTGYKGFR